MSNPPPGTGRSSPTRRGLALLVVAGTGCFSGAELANVDEHLEAQGCDTPQIFADHCAGGPCHTATDDGHVTGGVDLIGSGLEQRVLDRPTDYSAVGDASSCPAPGTELIVDGGDPEASLIVTKSSGGFACGLAMPPPGYPPLPTADIECIRAWAVDLALGAGVGGGGAP